MRWRSRRLRPAYRSLASLPTGWLPSARTSFFSSTSRGRHGSMHGSCADGDRLPHWSVGRSSICLCTPCGRRSSSSCSRRFSATADGSRRSLLRQLAHVRLELVVLVPHRIQEQALSEIRAPLVVGHLLNE